MRQAGVKFQVASHQTIEKSLVQARSCERNSTSMMFERLITDASRLRSTSIAHASRGLSRGIAVQHVVALERQTNRRFHGGDCHSERCS